jgi:hypothetical protein
MPVCFQQKADWHGGSEAAARNFLKIRLCLFFTDICQKVNF